MKRKWASVCCALLLPLLPLSAAGDEVGAGVDGDASSQGEELSIGLKVPLTSPLFAQTPVAVVGDEPITIRDLTKRIASIHAGRAEQRTSAKKNYAALLERIIATKLIVQEAKNIGFDERPEIESQIDAYATKLLVQGLLEDHLAGLEPPPDRVEELYRKMSRELRMTTLKFEGEADAASFEESIGAGADFSELADRFVEEGRAEEQSDGGRYLKLADLLPNIAREAYEMEVGDVSAVFRTSEAVYLIFRLDDARFYEDPEVEAEARRRVLDGLRREKADAYIEALIAKHCTIDEDLLAKLDFQKKTSGLLWFRKEEPVDFQKLREDTRVLATVRGEEPFVVTVGDLAAALEARQFHGVEGEAARKKLNRQKWPVLQDILLKKSGRIEAAALGRDESDAFREAIAEYTNSLLFETFVNKVIAPRIAMDEEDLRGYYEDHVADFSSPAMLRMNGLAFHERGDAERAVARLRRGADFRWVSANSAGQVEEDDPKAGLFDNVLLSVSSLPDELREAAEGAQKGDALLYSDPEGRHHAVLISAVFPPTPRDYEDVRKEIAQIVFQEKVRASVEDWSRRLREVYDSRIFVTWFEE